MSVVEFRPRRSAPERLVALEFSETDFLRLIELVQRQMIGEELDDRMEPTRLLLAGLTYVADRTADLIIEQQYALVGEFGPTAPGQS